ncbi:type IV secretory system conjugative DNA transfer family protein [Deltaproteobacteria bacterium OttesenSCG-928-M10]|nr:type IV secretory system conjugative DNA transfer family protein [Deltaproteobacteria bacterium OttesenSCG-928-M10]
MSQSNRGKYGHISRAAQSGSKWRWLVIALIIFWGLVVCSFNAERVAALANYHPGLGKPLAQIGGYRLYAPWKIIQWGSRYQQNERVTKIVDQTYLAGVGVPLVLFIIYLAAQQGLKGRDDLHGSARWAEFKDIDNMGYLKSEGVYVGGWWHPQKKIHYYLRHNGPEHVLCFAPTRSGKGVGLILPTLLAWPHSSVVLDIKGENHALTTGYLSSLGNKTLRFDPSDSEGASAAFNPLEEIRLDSAMSIPDVQQIASMVMDPNGKGLEDYWNKAAFGFFGGAVLHCLIKTLYEQKRAASLYDVAVMLEDPTRPVKEVFDEMLKMDHAAMLGEMYPQLLKKNPDNPLGESAHVYIASAARGMLSKADNELSGVVNTATSNLALYKDPVVAQNISRCDFRLNDLMNHDVPVNLYLVISPADIDRLRPLLRIFVAQMLGRITEKMEFEDGASKAGYKHRLLLMLDEFTSLGKLAIVERGIAYMAGYGCKGYFIVQDTKQLNQAYGADNAIMANCHIRIAYAPNLPETAEYLSKMAGTTTVVDKKISISGGGGKGGKSRSTSISETSRPLLTPDECMRLPGLSKNAAGQPVPGDMLIFTAGNPPIYGRQILYFADPVFSARAKVKAPGVAKGWSRGLSDSLYFPMPLTGLTGSAPSAPVEQPRVGQPEATAVAEQNQTEEDIIDDYKKLLAA